jgi:type IV pilus assembly protein PilF
MKGLKLTVQSLSTLLLSASILSACATSSDGKRDLTRTQRAEMLIEIANGALNEGDPTGALEHLMRAEREDPNLADLHHSKALAFFAKHDLPTAILEARKAVALKPGYSDANNTLGKLLMDQGKNAEAATFLSRAATDPLNRDAYKALTSLGIMSYRRGDYDKSEGYLSRAIEAAPTQACVAYYYRGHLQLRESHFDEAVRDYDQAGKRMCGGFADAQLAIGIAYERNQQFELARKKFLEVQNRYPKSKIADQAMTHLRTLP